MICTHYKVVHSTKRHCSSKKLLCHISCRAMYYHQSWCGLCCWPNNKEMWLRIRMRGSMDMVTQPRYHINRAISRGAVYRHSTVNLEIPERPLRHHLLGYRLLWCSSAFFIDTIPTVRYSIYAFFDPALFDTSVWINRPLHMKLCSLIILHHLRSVHLHPTPVGKVLGGPLTCSRKVTDT